MDKQFQLFDFDTIRLSRWILHVLWNIELSQISFSNTSKYLPSLYALAILLPYCFRRPLTPFTLANSSTFSSPRLRALLKRSSDTQGTWLHLEHPRRLYRLNSSSRGLLDCFSVLRFECHCCCSFLHGVLRNMWNTCGGSILKDERCYIRISLNGHSVEVNKVGVQRYWGYYLMNKGKFSRRIHIHIIKKKRCTKE